MRPGSIKSRITLLVLGAVLAGWLVAAFFTVRAARHEAAELFDGHLVQAAAMLLAQAAQPHAAEDDDDDDAVDEPQHAETLHKYARRVIFQVWRGGRLTLHSAHAPNTRLAAAVRGFSEVTLDGRRWRVYAVVDPARDLQVLVGESLDARDEITEEIIAGQLWPLVSGLPMLALLVWLAVRQGVAPLDRLGCELEQRDARQLQPLAETGLVAELRPVVSRLNALFCRVEQALAQERRFTADAAHELRTPLAGLRAQAQVAAAADDPAQRQHALESLIQGVDRTTRLVEQMLTLARADQMLAQSFPPVDLHVLAQAAVAEAVETLPAVCRRGIDLELCGAPALMPGEAAWLAILLRNLIDNAVRHAPEQGQVRVSVGADTTTVVLVVADSGAGVDAASRSRLGERFFRALDGAGNGSGLGLSIVSRIVALHHGQLEFGVSSLGGLAVTVRFLRHGGGEGVADPAPDG